MEERAATPEPNGSADPGAAIAPPEPTPRWAAAVVWLATFGGLAVVVVFGEAVVQTRYGIGIHESIPTVLRRFDGALAATGWTDAARFVAWGAGALALVAAAVYLWLALTPPDADP